MVRNIFNEAVLLKTEPNKSYRPSLVIQNPDVIYLQKYNISKAAPIIIQTIHNYSAIIIAKINNSAHCVLYNA